MYTTLLMLLSFRVFVITYSILMRAGVCCGVREDRNKWMSTYTSALCTLNSVSNVQRSSLVYHVEI